MVQALPGGSVKFAPDPATATVEWCVEGPPLDSAEEAVLLWHGLNASGGITDADRISLITTGDPLIFDSRADSELNKIASELKRTDLPIYAITTTKGDDVDVLAFYAHRPDGPTLAHLISDVVHGRARVPARYNPKTKKITIATP
jgi:hypothetical protein